MALLSILCYPDPRLHTVAAPVAAVDDRARAIAQDMLDTMYEAQGIGLAATQVDIHERIVVMDVSEERNQPVVLFNPEIVWFSEERHVSDEGCLSVPGIYDGVERAAQVRVQSQDMQGAVATLDADDLLAVCIQHEMDHLLGKVFVEYLSPLKRTRIRSKMIKRQREDRT